MSEWYQRDRKRFAEEVLAWKQHGFELDVEHLTRRRRAMFRGNVVASGTAYLTEVEYPEGFPYARPIVRLPELAISPTDEHRTLADGILCLRAYFPDQWKSKHLGISLLPDVERWIDSHHSRVWQNPHEAPDLMVLDRRYSRITVLFDDAADGRGLARNGPLLVDETIRGNGRLLHVREIGERSVAYPALLEGQRRSGIYTTLDAAPVELAKALRVAEGVIKPDDALSLIRSAGGTVTTLGRHKKQKAPNQHQLIALRFEGSSGSKSRTLWEVLWWDNAKGGYVAAQVHFRSDTFNRVRNVVDLDRLQNGHVAVLGVGAIGGTVALELARAGVGRLTLIDSDVVAAGNLARHVAEVNQIGLPKTHAVGSQILRRFPTALLSYGLRGNPVADLFTDYEGLVELAKTVDVVAVCVGNENVHRFINDALIASGKTGVYAWVGPDAVAGRIIRLQPGVSGCYWCYESWVEEENPSGYFAQLPDIEDINTLPLDYGCNTPAVPGSSFDHGRIALAQTRQVVQAILGRGAKYPYDETPHLLLTNRPVETIDKSDFESVIGYSRIQRMPDCPKCGSTVATPAALSDDEAKVIADYLS